MKQSTVCLNLGLGLQQQVKFNYATMKQALTKLLALFIFQALDWSGIQSKGFLFSMLPPYESGCLEAMLASLLVHVSFSTSARLLCLLSGMHVKSWHLQNCKGSSHDRRKLLQKILSGFPRVFLILSALPQSHGTHFDWSELSYRDAHLSITFISLNKLTQRIII